MWHRHYQTPRQARLSGHQLPGMSRRERGLKPATTLGKVFCMRNWFVGSIAALAVMALSSAAFAQSFAHDLNGYWEAVTPPGTLHTVGTNRPPMTAWGKAKFGKVKTGADGKQLSAGVSREKKDWNDPVLWCDPPGFPRIVSLPTPPAMRFLQ